MSLNPDKNEQAFLEYVRGAKYKMCPFCNFWVEKTVGCDHMRCRCGKEFCYRCGGVYRQCPCYDELWYEYGHDRFDQRN
jgi:hypothetical protein